MIFDGIAFHNVEEMVREGDGWRLSRLPRSVADQLDPGIKDGSSWFSSGIELRFKLVSETVTLYLRGQEMEEAQTALIYFGQTPGGWQYSTKTIGTERNAITIRYPEAIGELEKMADTFGQKWSPRLVRVILPYGKIHYLGKEGETALPERGDMPQKRVLCYGSSITHGSLGLIPSSTYVFGLASRLGMDYINQGYAGTAYMEKPMAEYICSRKDWDIATLEMGINMLGTSLSDEEYEERIRQFLAVMAADGRPVFTTDIFRFNGGEAQQNRAAVFRDIVKRQAARVGIVFTPGEELLHEPWLISADMVHPAWEGQLLIAERWSEGIKTSLREKSTV